MRNNVARMALFVTVFFGLASAVMAAQVEEAYEPGGLPEPLQSLLADEHIVIYVTNGSSSWDARTDEATTTYSLKTDESANIESFNRSVSGDKTFEVLLDRSVLEEAIEEDNVQAGLIDAYQSGVVKYRGVGFWNSALVTATKTTTSTGSGIYSGVTSVASWLR